MTRSFIEVIAVDASDEFVDRIVNIYAVPVDRHSWKIWWGIIRDMNPRCYFIIRRADNYWEREA